MNSNNYNNSKIIFRNNFKFKMKSKMTSNKCNNSKIMIFKKKSNLNSNNYNNTNNVFNINYLKFTMTSRMKSNKYKINGNNSIIMFKFNNLYKNKMKNRMVNIISNNNKYKPSIYNNKR
jgi:hypothetical protein